MHRVIIRFVPERQNVTYGTVWRYVLTTPGKACVGVYSRQIVCECTSVELSIQVIQKKLTFETKNTRILKIFPLNSSKTIRKTTKSTLKMPCFTSIKP